MKEIKCKDAGIACDFKARGRDDQEVLKSVRDHGRSVHHLRDQDMPDDKLRPLIHEVAA